jgi:hypothetical protein
MKLNIFALTRIVICGACAALAKRLRISPMRRGSGSVRWKQPPVEALLVRDVVDGGDDEIDRHDVDAPALDARPWGSTAAGAMRIFWISLKK